MRDKRGAQDRLDIRDRDSDTGDCDSEIGDCDSKKKPGPRAWRFTYNRTHFICRAVENAGAIIAGKEALE